MDSTDQPNSICHIQAIQMYQLPTTDAKIDLPFSLLNGEAVEHSGTSVDGLLVLTNYRLFLQLCDSQHHVPLGLIEVVEHRDLFYLHIGCKDARSYRCTFDNNEVCLDWFGRLLKSCAPPRQLEELFAFFYYAWTKENGDEMLFSRMERNKSLVRDDNMFRTEVERLRFDIHGAWRISSMNKNYGLCPSYPPQLLVPACITDETLETVAKFRSSRRIPTVVWRHVGNGAVIARCSQPEVGWLGWRSAEDEDLLKAISDACTFDRGPSTMLDNVSSSPTSTNSEESAQSLPVPADTGMQEKKKVLIMDARSYTTAVANRARGGGCECPEYYPGCEIQFMNLANIHSIRKSFHALRQLCTSSADQPNWFSLLEGTRWLQHMSGLMKAAVTLVGAVEREARPVLVHCSDGWDRTPQIVALAELLLDPFYRTLEGFRILIEREWLAYGHKFADRCGHATGSDDQNERCPVFLQWLDCVHQLLVQFPCAFEFSHTYLVKLAQHTYTNLFGTFLCNTKRERVERVNDNTFSVWHFLNAPCFCNHLYPLSSSAPGTGSVLWPQYNVRELHLWTEVYLGSLELQSSWCTNYSAIGSNVNHMTKTRSYGDLLCAAEAGRLSNRRNSDPSIIADAIKINGICVSTPATTSSDAIPSANGETAYYHGGDLDVTDACNSDCIYKNLSDDDSGGLLDAAKADSNGFESDEDPLPLSDADGIEPRDDSVCRFSETSCSQKTVICNKTDGETAQNDVFESICLRSRTHSAKGDINHNGDAVEAEDNDSDTECTTTTESKSENTVCDISVSAVATGRTKCDVLGSVETSTETLTPDKVVSRSNSLPKEVAEFERQSNSDILNGNADACKVCAQNIKFIHNSKHSHRSTSTSGKNSRYSTPPPYSRTSSGANDWEGPRNACARSRLGDDGLVPLRSNMQERLWQIIQEHRRKVEALQRELHTYRRALIKQVCHQCNHNDSDKLDDSNKKSSEYSGNSTSSEVDANLIEQEKHNSVAESVGSVGEGQPSAVESLRSDISWEAVEETPVYQDSIPTLWVPDHAVSRCTGCQTQFWLGRRKHHCRNCGRIFCADCSENSTPLPSEQLYDPVRVCTSCYGKLKFELPLDGCKHAASPNDASSPAASPAHQIAASTN